MPGTNPSDTASSSPGRRRADALFVAAMVLAFTVPPVTQAILDARRGHLPTLSEVSIGLGTSRAVRATEGETASGSDERSWLDALARRWWAPAVDGLLDRGSSTTVVGSSGWLFYRQAVRFVAGNGLSDEIRMGRVSSHRSTVHDVIVDFHHQLVDRGIRLIVVPVPTKATVYPERLSARLAAPESAAMAPNDPTVAKLLARLADSGVEVLDPLPTLLAAKRDGDAVYLSTDTHWSWLGMRRVAEAVAERLPPRPAHKQLFSHRRVLFESDGDLSRMLGHPRGPRPPLRVDVTQIVPARGGSDPIGQPALHVVIGDSSLLVFSEPDLGLGNRAGFAEQLADLVERPVDRLAIPAGGATRVRQLLALEPERLARATTVIWVFTQRDLRFATDGWHTVRLPAASVESSATPTPLSGPVTARVVMVSRPPRPADYADCLMIVRYRFLDPTTDEPGPVVDVAHLGWRDFTPTPAARLAAGDLVDLTLTDLPADRQLDRSCWVDDVGLETHPRWAAAHDLR